MGFSPGLWLRFVARRFGIDNRRRRDAGNEYNQSLSRMVKLRRRQLHACTAIGYVWWQNLLRSSSDPLTMLASSCAEACSAHRRANSKPFVDLPLRP